MTRLAAAIAAPAGHAPTTAAGLFLALVAAVALVVYAGSCWLSPYRRCWCCSGTGRHTRQAGNVFRDCRWCRGSGRRLRLGRRAFNHFAQMR